MSTNSSISCGIPASKVFNNQYLVGNILSFLADEPMDNLDIRRLNKAFNDEFLRIIRKNYRQVKIEIINDIWRHGYEAKPIEWVYINYRSIKLQKVDRYFSFLKDVFKVKVERIVTNGVQYLPERDRDFIHKCIFEILTENAHKNIKALQGIEAICNKSNIKDSNFVNLVEKCKEYGPIGFRILKRISQKCHFKKLIITDRLLKIIAKKSVLKSKCKEECVQTFNQLINSNISCDLLILHLTEHRNEEKNGDHFDLPREILDLMIEKWEVKSMGLKFIYTYGDIKPNKWMENGWLTSFRFNDPYKSVKKNQNLKISHVNVDLSESFYCSQDIRHQRENTNGYENLVAIIRRVMPTDHITITCSHWFCHTYGTPQLVERSLLAMAQKDDARNLSIDVRYFPKLKTFKHFGAIAEPKWNISKSIIPSYHRTLKGTHHPKQFQSEEWIGRQVLLTDEKSLKLKFFIFVNENDNFEFPIEEMRKHPNALVNYFKAPFNVQL